MLYFSTSLKIKFSNSNETKRKSQAIEVRCLPVDWHMQGDPGWGQDNESPGNKNGQGGGRAEGPWGHGAKKGFPLAASGPATLGEPWLLFLLISQG